MVNVCYLPCPTPTFNLCHLNQGLKMWLKLLSWTLNSKYRQLDITTFISNVLVVLVVPNVNAKVADAVEDGPKLK